MIVRSIKVIRGSLPVELVCRPAFNYARDPHDTVLSPNGAAFQSKNLSLWLTSSLPLEHDDDGTIRMPLCIFHLSPPAITSIKP